MKHQNIISTLTLEEKCYLLSGKDFWQTRSVKAKGLPNITLTDGLHGIRKQEGSSSSVVNCTKLNHAMDVIDNFDLNVVGFEVGYLRSSLGDAATQDGLFLIFSYVVSDIKVLLFPTVLITV